MSELDANRFSPMLRPWFDILEGQQVGLSVTQGSYFYWG